MATMQEAYQAPLNPEYIKEIRQSRGLTQKEAADKVGVTRECWAAWEGGVRPPSKSLVILIRLVAENII